MLTYNLLSILARVGSWVGEGATYIFLAPPPIKPKKGAINIYTLVGMKYLDFKGSDGGQVSGVNLYFTYEDEKVKGSAAEAELHARDRRGLRSPV